MGKMSQAVVYLNRDIVIVKLKDRQKDKWNEWVWIGRVSWFEPKRVNGSRMIYTKQSLCVYLS